MMSAYLRMNLFIMVPFGNKSLSLYRGTWKPVGIQKAGMIMSFIPLVTLGRRFHLNRAFDRIVPKYIPSFIHLMMQQINGIRYYANVGIGCTGIDFLQCGCDQC